MTEQGVHEARRGGFCGDMDCTGVPPRPVPRATGEGPPSSQGLETAPIEALRPSCEGRLARGHLVTPEWLLLQLVGRTQTSCMA